MYQHFSSLTHTHKFLFFISIHHFHLLHFYSFIYQHLLHFILSDCGNFDIKVKRCKFVGFVKDVTDCGCLRCIFCFRIKDKEKEEFYINFYSTIFLKSFFFFFPSLLQLNNYNGYVCNL